MSPSIDINDELMERIDALREDDESYEEFLAELVSIYETEGRFGTEGYSE
ncbi:MAG TPA: hypothetical protein VKA37_12340 [Halobacteriales archaeon]|nr:hypothetical protein [Halobacteriales archaeon]